MTDPGWASSGMRIQHPRRGHVTGLLLIVPHAGSRALGHRGEGTDAPALLLTGSRNSKPVETNRKKNNLSPGSDCCLFTSMTRCPFSSLSTSECMSCVCICCCFLISSQCRDVTKMHIWKLQMLLHQTKPTAVYQGEGCLQMPLYSFSGGLSWCSWCDKPRIAEGRMGP